eukprot:scaffold1487_cov143-Ochromonas_danica.AAC.1
MGKEEEAKVLKEARIAQRDLRNQLPEFSYLSKVANLKKKRTSSDSGCFVALEMDSNLKEWKLFQQMCVHFMWKGGVPEEP